MKTAIFKSLVWCCIGIIAFSTPVLAAEFSAEMTSDQMGEGVKSKIYIKGDKVRMEGTSPEGETYITIMDIKAGSVITLMPQEKIYMEMSGMMAQSQMSQFEIEEEIAKVADKRLVGVEHVNGYLCDKYEIVYHDKSLGVLTQWVSQKLNYPLKMIYSSSYGTSSTEYKNIREGGVTNSLFEIPAGYSKMEMPGMGMMGGSAY